MNNGTAGAQRPLCVAYFESNKITRSMCTPHPHVLALECERPTSDTAKTTLSIACVAVTICARRRTRIYIHVSTFVSNVSTHMAKCEIYSNVPPHPALMISEQNRHAGKQALILTQVWPARFRALCSGFALPAVPQDGSVEDRPSYRNRSEEPLWAFGGCNFKFYHSPIYFNTPTT